MSNQLWTLVVQQHLSCDKSDVCLYSCLTTLFKSSCPTLKLQRKGFFLIAEICNISISKHRSMTRPLFYILLQCILTISKTFHLLFHVQWKVFSVRSYVFGFPLITCNSPQVDSADVPLDPWGGAEDLFTVLPQTFEHHLHGVLKEMFTTKESEDSWFGQPLIYKENVWSHRNSLVYDMISWCDIIFANMTLHPCFVICFFIYHGRHNDKFEQLHWLFFKIFNIGLCPFLCHAS